MDAAIHHEQERRPEAIAREALADCPTYLEHICSTFSACRDSLRAGQDTNAMNAFARGASDLGQFIQLFSYLNQISRPTSTRAADEFVQAMHACIASLDLAMHRGDMVAVSDQLEGRLVPLLERFPDVASEIGSGLC